eukprot:SAG31_NODE_7953_length_1555_cov_2.929945_1_plen_73_part_10
MQSERGKQCRITEFTSTVHVLNLVPVRFGSHRGTTGKFKFSTKFSSKFSTKFSAKFSTRIESAAPRARAPRPG